MVLPEEDQEKFRVYAINHNRNRISSEEKWLYSDVIFYYVACHVMVPGGRDAGGYTRLR